jgi:uncharacterized membrane protein YedE/YeeE
MRTKLAALLLGIPFGFTIAWTGLDDPQVIRRMMLLQSFYLYEMFAVAVTAGLLGSLALRRLRLRALVTRQAIDWEVSRPERRHVVGSLIFGCGWALASSCPGPIAAQLATGLWWSAFTIAGIAGGVLLYLLRQERSARAAVRSAPADAVPEPGLSG